MPFYDEAITGTPEYETLLSAVRKNTLPAAAAGLSYIHKAFLISNICRDTGKTGLVIVPSEARVAVFARIWAHSGRSRFFIRSGITNFLKTARHHSSTNRNVRGCFRAFYREILPMLCFVPTRLCSTHCLRRCSGNRFLK